MANENRNWFKTKQGELINLDYARRIRLEEGTSSDIPYTRIVAVLDNDKEVVLLEGDDAVNVDEVRKVYKEITKALISTRSLNLNDPPSNQAVSF